MGTRHHQRVIDREGREKVAQYGQWDGYPEGQGIRILRALRLMNIDVYAEQVERIKDITPQQEKVVNEYGEGWERRYPWISRDCGSDIHLMIGAGKVPFVHRTPLSEARAWCEGFYTIDLQNRTFRTEYYDTDKTYSLDNLPSDEQYIKETAVRDE